MSELLNKGGRPKGSPNKISQLVREQAMLTGDLPHEILLKMARGPFEHMVLDCIDEHNIPRFRKTWVVLDVNGRLDAAKAAAPYFAPRMSSVEMISGASDAELDEIIRGAATEAGIRIEFDRVTAAIEEGKCDRAVRPQLSRSSGGAVRIRTRE